MKLSLKLSSVIPEFLNNLNNLKKKNLRSLLLFLTLGLSLSICSFSVLHAGIFSDPKNPNSETSSGMMGPVSYADAVAKAAPAVVSINTAKAMPANMNPLLQDPMLQHFFGDPRALRENERGMQSELPKEILNGLGSGVIVNDKGYILTNYHVIQDADTISVTLPDNRTAEAKMIGNDPDTDLAVLQIKLDNLPVIPLASGKKVRAGDVVLAIGNPFGFDKTVTQGIVSATERAGSELGIMEKLIQTDAAINPGNSGGALIDAFGNIVGINTAIVSGTGGYQGIGFAIPIHSALDIMNKLIQVGHISRGFLGVSLENMNKEIRDQIDFKEGDGAFIRAIMRNSPAQKAGLLPGDVITKINNDAVKDNRVGMDIVSKLTPGKSYPIEIYRKGEHMIFSVLLSDRKAQKTKTKAKEEHPNKTAEKRQN